ncbi:hypothetical protein [Mycolicibacterium phlei]|uniref:hypothetical protein n=1 Tax=Mycolicibacterium phlei TaxID=1771 RepID=UPI0037C7D19C
MSARGHARYIGRVGALALALGVGAAVAAPPIAFADPTPGAEPSASDHDNTDTGPQPSETGDLSDGVTGIGATSFGLDDVILDAGADEAVGPALDPDGTTVVVGTSPPVTYGSSGGAHTSDTDDIEALDESGSFGSAATVSDDGAAEAPPPTRPRVVPLFNGHHAPAPQAPGDGGGDHWPGDTAANDDAWLRPVGQVHPRPVSTSPVRDSADELWLAPTYLEVPVVTVAAPVRRTPAIVLPAPDPPTEPGTRIRRVSGLLTAALSPLLVPGPAVPLDSPAAWLLMAWVRRQLPGQHPDAEHVPEAPRLAATHGTFTAAGTVTGHDTARSLIDELVALFTRLITGGLIVDVDNPFTIDDVDLRTGTVTGSVNVTALDTTALSFALQDQPEAGAVHVDPVTGRWTFTPTPVSRVQAFTVSGAEVAFAILAGISRGAGVPITVTAPVHAAETAAYPALAGVPVSGVRLAPNDIGSQVVVRNDPVTATYETAVAIIDPQRPSATVTAPVPGALSHFTFAPDHTAYNTTVLADSGDDSYELSVLDAIGAGRTIPLAGTPAGPVVFDADGGAYQSSYRHDPDTDSYVTTVTVLDRGRHVEASVDGYPVAFGTGGGIAYQVTESRPFADGDAADRTTVTAIDPVRGATRTAAQLPGAALEFVTAPDGTAFQTVRVVAGDRYRYSLARIPKDGAVQTISLTGSPVGAITLGPGGTALLTMRPGGVVVIGPDGDVAVVTLPAGPRGGPRIAADGTAHQTVRTGEVAVIDVAGARLVETATTTADAPVTGPDGTVYTHHNGASSSLVEIARRGSEPTAVEIDGQLVSAGRTSSASSVLQGVRFAPDGTPFVISAAREVPADPVLGGHDGLVVTVLGDDRPARMPLAGTDAGVLKFLSDNTFTYIAPVLGDGVGTAVTFVDLAAGTADGIHLDGYFTDHTVGADNTVFVVTNADFDPLSGVPGREYALTVAAADGSLWTTTAIDGAPYEGLVSGPDGAVYQVVEGADGLSTGVLVVRPGGLTPVRIDLDGYPQSPVVFDSAGVGYVTTGVVDALTGGPRTVVTVVAAPAHPAVTPA